MIDITHIEPNQKLLKYVRRICIFESKREIQYKQKLTPSAYTYFSYNLEDIPTPIIGKEKISLKQRLQVVGPKTRDDISVIYNGNLSQILVEFSATGFYYLFHKSPANLANKFLDINEFLADNSTTQLDSKLKNCADKEQQVIIIEKWLLEKSYRSSAYCEYIDKAVNILEKNHGDITITDLSSQIFVSERQFDRRFREMVGINPKHFSKIVQLHYVINLMQKKEYGSIQDLSYKANYYDASSFSNRFKNLTGFSPKEFINSEDHIALKYFTDLP